jgi:predicted glycosyltransferase
MNLSLLRLSGPFWRPRVVLYSHDTMGLGHMRRNLLIAQTLADGGQGATVLMVCGAVQASALILPTGVDCVTLPALRKSQSGKYDARRLQLSLSGLIELRSRTIRAAVDAFRPDLLIADNVPRGALGELEPTLQDLAARSVPRVLGLRDVLDDPPVVARQWREARNEEAIADYYEAIWVYGDPSLYDLAAECDFGPDVRRKLHYLGYLDQRLRLRAPGPPAAEEDPLPDGPFALCTVGGGQDGDRLAEAFAMAEPPGGVQRVVVAGPDMDPRGRHALHSLAAHNPALTVIDFAREPARLVAGAGCLVAMAGYNTMCEALSFRKRALVVPRVSPRSEQLIRAERLRERGLVELLHPDALAPERISSWLADNFGRPARRGVDLGGLQRLRRLAGDLLRECAPSTWRPAGNSVASAAH